MVSIDYEKVFKISAMKLPIFLFDTTQKPLIPISRFEVRLVPQIFLIKDLSAAARIIIKYGKYKKCIHYVDITC